MAKFSGHVLCLLASSLSNVVRQVDRQVGRHADKKFSLGNFFSWGATPIHKTVCSSRGGVPANII